MFSIVEADFFNLKRESGESAADVRKRILEVERKCPPENPHESTS